MARQRVFWAVSLGAIALVLLLAGGLTALSNVVTTTGLPFLIVLAFMCYSLFEGLRSDHEAVSTGPEAAERSAGRARPASGATAPAASGAGQPVTAEDRLQQQARRGDPR